jgi:hypothetical protein
MVSGGFDFECRWLGPVVDAVPSRVSVATVVSRVRWVWVQFGFGSSSVRRGWLSRLGGLGSAAISWVLNNKIFQQSRPTVTPLTVSTLSLCFPHAWGIRAMHNVIGTYGRSFFLVFFCSPRTDWCVVERVHFLSPSALFPSVSYTAGASGVGTPDRMTTME